MNKLLTKLTDEFFLKNRQLIVTYDSGDFQICLRQNTACITDLTSLCKIADMCGYKVELHTVHLSDAVFYDIEFIWLG